VSQVTSPVSGSGRRERKKERTRDALIDAAMRLFAEQGYERTAVREITDAVDVSERTFFRYFASKEDLALSFIQDSTAAFAEALAGRPAGEDPFTAARRAFHVTLRAQGADPGDVLSYLSVMRLIDSTPSLLAAYMRYVHDHDDELVAVLARREGVDPATDRRPHTLVAMLGALAFLANRDWLSGTDQGPDAMAAAFDAYADAARPALGGHWR
jgi:AcrR family transcriptional regulator